MCLPTNSWNALAGSPKADDGVVVRFQETGATTTQRGLSHLGAKAYTTTRHIWNAVVVSKQRLRQVRYNNTHVNPPGLNFRTYTFPNQV